MKNQRQLIKLGEQLAKHPTLASLNAASKPRNQLALSPLLKKGGVHAQDDVSQQRKKARRQTKQQLRKTDWLS